MTALSLPLQPSPRQGSPRAVRRIATAVWLGMEPHQQVAAGRRSKFTTKSRSNQNIVGGTNLPKMVNFKSTFLFVIGRWLSTIANFCLPVIFFPKFDAVENNVSITTHRDKVQSDVKRHLQFQTASAMQKAGQRDGVNYLSISIHKQYAMNGSFSLDEYACGVIKNYYLLKLECATDGQQSFVCF